MVKWSDTGENVLRQLQIIQIQHTYVISSQKKFFSPTLLGHFPLKKSDFLGIFKNVLTEFHCIEKVKITLFNDMTVVEILWIRTKLNALKMVVDRSPNGIKCKNTGGQ